MILNKKGAASVAAANVVGGKTARACDSCIKKRARWYCAADDAFLCQACDSSVHSANLLARRHERVRLKTASSSLKSSTNSRSCDKSEVPSWHRGFTRKRRTPRQGKSGTPRNRFPLVPEVGADDLSYEENEEEQLLYRVPIYDPFVAELCTSPNSNTVPKGVNGNESRAVSLPNYYGVGNGNSPSSHGFDLPSDMDLADFAADVDSLLGRGLDDDERFGMEGLGLMDCQEKESTTTEEGSTGRVKVEDEEDSYMACQADTEIDLMREPFVLNFEDYDDSPTSCAEDEEEDYKLGARMSHGQTKSSIEKHQSCKKRKIFLTLDYDHVITQWNSQSKGSPWTLGDRPDFDSDFLPDFMGTLSGTALHHYPYGELNGVIGLHPAMTDGGRDARVSRYREKRRTRLFSKKIRYEVRKLNAEKRPRMKGRFVKRASFVTSGSVLPTLRK
ncbi:zinc finger protein CONSTANS-LIKE 16-like [Argentina anserina]|uniref:zinc finger protein CONSTANS-LIKE 16-like n=1 Tax=Argentina anserina TaxID=57926 RepID=UPI002176602F|nr:zinc finger protein CONSTANS-LIKE 16-like [Potentilla anserina]